MRYIPHTEADIRAMLAAVDLPDLDALFSAIPAELQLDRALAVPDALPEPDLRRHLAALAERNIPSSRAISFLGGGVYRHHIPVAVSQLLLRGEIYTAYTPYQPEIAQGTLQMIFEFQTMVAELLGTDIANASLYDGSTALAEAALMALRVKSQAPARVLVSQALHPHWRAVTRLMLTGVGAELVDLPVDPDGRTSRTALAAELARGAAAVCLGYPTFFGTLDDLPAARALCDAHDALLIATFQEAIAFGLLTPPGALGADIVCGEGQSLGVPASVGGPHLGLLGTRESLLRQMPGRIAGETVDVRGNRGFVLTMSTREQHIRREKATSNICTNVALMATAATIAMTLTGPQGLQTVARASHLRAEEAKAAILALPGMALYFNGPTFNEFVVRTPKPAAHYVETLAPDRIAPGIALAPFAAELGDPDLAHALLVAATELTTSDEIAALAAGLARV